MTHSSTLFRGSTHMIRQDTLVVIKIQTKTDEIRFKHLESQVDKLARERDDMANKARQEAQ